MQFARYIIDYSFNILTIAIHVLNLNSFLLTQIMEMSNMAGYHHHQRERDRNERRYSVPHGPNAPLPPAASEDLHAWSIYR